MDLLYCSSPRISSGQLFNPRCSSTSRSHSPRVFTLRSSLPFPPENAKYHRELQAAVNVVEKSCRLCVDVRKSLFGSNERILEKNDQTPVTVADFGVQALISLELSRLFPSIPLVAEEDSKSIRSTPLSQAVVSAVIDKASLGDELLSQDDVLEAIDRGGKDAFAFGTKPAIYWVLDPIDGTKGFLKGGEALYVVGLALVVEGEIVLGVMGCPNWEGKFSKQLTAEDQEDRTLLSGSGIVMVAHIGCGTWRKRLSDMLVDRVEVHSDWVRCFVDKCCLVHEARFCISDSQTWESLPISILFSSTNNADSIGDRQITLLPTCCGSLCKYLMVASGKASVFILQARTQTIIKAWDHAAGVICVLEAGGQVTDWKGSQFDLAADQVERRVIFISAGVLVTNGNLHKQILEIISVSSSIV
ncbi:putative PAP-specific phosphatase, mitochondrial [Telopea speciosissima]|uniref:putative PAP-specific phosphatase, mitochondrial n=1 Tax=Telopea speciosissima TaxID=54955 RepID=UPI001CC6D269|nr:putative PAP-specific phosphatase, mitochondrial [Telopea speciosissima]